ncbi:unnamed protein product [Arabis nemorensis]|uniref:Uncharacterized protein n=1 Tax=Arabis nemorensis TaxID=586526 RepID=A0A565C452_9BRAS|nr:unnamed protein product [Arabis nemorensis]
MRLCLQTAVHVCRISGSRFCVVQGSNDAAEELLFVELRKSSSHIVGEVALVHEAWDDSSPTGEKDTSGFH